MNTQVDTETEAAKRQVAKHSLLDTQGAVVEDFEDATGVRYQDVETGKTIDFQLKANTDATRMLALFGARTLMTNEASAVRQKEGKSGTGALQVQAIEERLALIFGTDGNGGQWVDRTREGGPRIDQQALADAVCEVMIAGGKFAPEDRDAKRAKLLETWAADPKKVGVAHSVPAVRDAYARLVGRTAKTVDDLAAMLT
jgi:phosphoribosylformylglycinamidine (FGAM) synthase PurS component